MAYLEYRGVCRFCSFLQAKQAATRSSIAEQWVLNTEEGREEIARLRSVMRDRRVRIAMLSEQFKERKRELRRLSGNLR